jgi:Pentapeptide repeats (8 copies)
MNSGQPLNELTRYRAFYSAGLTIEADPDSDPPRLAIDGQRVEIRRSGGSFVYADPEYNLVSETLRGLADQIIDVMWDRKRREEIRDEHVEKLVERKSWNAWRRNNPDTRPLLFDAKLYRRDLAGFNFCNANLIGADLREATLTNANFHEANLGGARLNNADLSSANFCRTDLYETDFSHSESSAARPTDLSGANLQGTQLARTNLSGANLVGCTIYGLSAWNLNLERATQGNLKILYRVPRADGSYEQDEFTVHDIELAQLVFLLLDNTRINNLFEQLTSKAVVILSRFKPEERKKVIDQLRLGLRKHEFLPIVFDFERPPARDLTETIKALVGLCHFAIVDITDPKSVPLELYATVTDYQVPFLPIIQAGEDPFALFHDFEKFSWMLPTLTYESAESFSEEVVKRCIIDRASEMWEQIRQFKGREKPAPSSVEECFASYSSSRDANRSKSGEVKPIGPDVNK